jgi:integrase
MSKNYVGDIYIIGHPYGVPDKNMSNMQAFLYNKKQKRPYSDTLQLTGPLYDAFIEQASTTGSGETRRNYTAKLRGFMLFNGFTKVEQLLFDNDPANIENIIIKFIRYLKNDRGQSPNSQRAYLVGLNAFYKFADWKMNRDINWEQIWRYVGSGINKSGIEDKPYKLEHIHKMLSISDERESVVLLMLCSTGMRLAALPLIALEDLEFIPQHGVYKVKVYSGFDEEYVTFTSRECAKAIDRYLDYRRRFGENLIFSSEEINGKIIKSSPLVRKQFDIKHPETTINPDPDRKDGYGNSTPYTIDVGESTIEHIISKLIAKAGLRQKINTKQNIGMFCTRTHHAIHQVHGLRKFFASQLEFARVRDQSIEHLLGHGVKKTLRGIYRKIDEDNLLADYMLGEPYLVINQEERERARADKLEAENSEQKQTITKAFEMYEEMRKEINEMKNERKGGLLET